MKIARMTKILGEIVTTATVYPDTIGARSTTAERIQKQRRHNNSERAFPSPIQLTYTHHIHMRKVFYKEYKSESVYFGERE